MIIVIPHEQATHLNRGVMSRIHLERQSEVGVGGVGGCRNMSGKCLLY